MSVHQRTCPVRSVSHPDLLDSPSHVGQLISGEPLTPTRSSCPALRRQEGEKSQRSQSHSVDPVHFLLSFNQVSLLLHLVFPLLQAFFLSDLSEYRCFSRPRKPYCSAGVSSPRWCQAATSSWHALVLVHVLLNLLHQSPPRARNKRKKLPAHLCK